MRIALHGGLIVLLTAVTFVGGMAWLGGLMLGRRWITVPALYSVLWGGAVLMAPLAGREPLPCSGEPLRMQSPFYCIALRHFVTPELADVARDAATQVARAHPGTVTLALDGGFPFTGLPLLPHLSHDDGEKLDLALYYADAEGRYLPGQARTPLGYFAFETLGQGTCPPAWPTLRWDLAWLQPFWADLTLERARLVALLKALSRDDRVGKLFVEPPLAAGLGVSHPRVRFQGCRAARHDDHVHLQL